MSSAGKNNQGFTIMEVLVVLAVTGGLLVTAFMLIWQKIQKTEFTTAINEVTSQIRTYYDNAANGYYANIKNFKCTPGPYVALGDGGDITISPDVTNNQGSHDGCIFMGRALQFQPVNDDGSVIDPEQVFAYNMVGQQYGLSRPRKVATDLTNVRARALSPDFDEPVGTGTALIPDTKETFRLQYGLTTSSMCYKMDSSSPCQQTGTVAFLISLSGGSSSSSGHVDTYPIRCTKLGQTEQGVVEQHREQAANMHKSASDLEKVAVQLENEASNLERQAKDSDGAEKRVQQSMDKLKNQNL